MNSPIQKQGQNPRHFGPSTLRKYRAPNLAGGESVRQSPLKDKAFLTFLDQNPPFELRPDNGMVRLREIGGLILGRHKEMPDRCTAVRLRNRLQCSRCQRSAACDEDSGQRALSLFLALAEPLTPLFDCPRPCGGGLDGAVTGQKSSPLMWAGAV